MNQSCRPCAKRKVRCDKTIPCSHCKRRKQDCSYSEPTPQEKIRKLEALVKSLGGDPNNGKQTATPQASPQDVTTINAVDGSPSGSGTGATYTNSPTMLVEDGQRRYMETSAWQDWFGRNQSGVANGSATRDTQAPEKSRDAFATLMCGDGIVDFTTMHPTAGDANVFWDNFEARVDPFSRLFLASGLRDLRETSAQPDKYKDFTSGQHALVFAIYLLGVISMSEEECESMVGQSRLTILSKLQVSCEQALSTGLFCAMDMTFLKALAFYVAAGLDRLSTQSLWPLMGLAIRGAEKLGLHRDGSLLNLLPIEVEERRRLWWQLQHLDLAISIKSGGTSLSLTADWDTRLPLNVEDDDINEETKETPEARKGMTSMSFCLWTFWVLDYQRRFFDNEKGRLGFSWSSNRSIPHAVKTKLIDDMEEGLNKNFLQYCDPIKPLEQFIQLSARNFICIMRLLTLHPSMYSRDPETTSEQHRHELLETCFRALEYNIAAHSQPLVKRFLWRIEGFFPWHAFICVLVEISHQKDPKKLKRIWDLLTDLESANQSLLQISDDRRKTHAAELIVTAWKAREQQGGPGPAIPKPAFVTTLEQRLSECRNKSAQPQNLEITQNDALEQMLQPMSPPSFLSEQDLNAFLDLDFDNIDWSFWSSVV